MVAASKMKKAQQVTLAGRPYANLLTDVLAALVDGIEDSSHPFLVQRELKTRGSSSSPRTRACAGP